MEGETVFSTSSYDGVIFSMGLIHNVCSSMSEFVIFF